MTDDYTQVAAAVLRTTRKRVADAIASLPEPLDAELRRVAGPYLDKNIQADPPRNIVVAVAYDQGIRELDVLAALSATSALGGMHSLILDDLVDNKDRDRRPWHDIYLAHVLYVLHHRMLEQICAADWLAHGSQVSLAAQMDTYAALVEEETAHVGVSTPYTTPDIVWRKCSPVKAVIERVLALAGRHGQKERMDEAADLTCFALCTLDDMLDWPEDYANRRFTYPVQCALDALGRSWCPAADDELREAIERELVYGVTHHRLLAEITRALERARVLADEVSPQLATYLAAALDSVRQTWKRHLRYLSAVELSLTTGS
jgi:hypothetical protein